MREGVGNRAERRLRHERSTLRLAPSDARVYAWAVGVDVDDIARAVAAWPQVQCAAAVFESCIPADLERPDHLGDLYVATAALAGDAAAVRVISAWVAELSPRAIRATGVQAYEPNDLEQDLVQMLVVGGAERPPKLTQYAARGPLRAWLRSCALRQCLDRRRRKSPETAAAAMPTLLADSRADPELRVLKARDREAFVAALETAFAALDSSTRAILRYYYLDKLDQRKIATIYDVHVATISRRLDKAREHVLATARKSLAEQGTPGHVWELVKSRLDVSLPTLLRSTADVSKSE